MATIAQVPFAISDLERILKGVDPAALLVPPRVLRRVIMRDRDLGGMGLVVPHRRSYVIAREPLLHIADRRGTLEVGKRADLIVLAANPLENITNTRHIVTIFHDGRQVNPRVPMDMAH